MSFPCQIWRYPRSRSASGAESSHSFYRDPEVMPVVSLDTVSIPWYCPANIRHQVLHTSPFWKSRLCMCSTAVLFVLNGATLWAVLFCNCYLCQNREDPLCSQCWGRTVVCLAQCFRAELGLLTTSTGFWLDHRAQARGSQQWIRRKLGPQEGGVVGRLVWSQMIPLIKEKQKTPGFLAFCIIKKANGDGKCYPWRFSRASFVFRIHYPARECFSPETFSISLSLRAVLSKVYHT